MEKLYMPDGARQIIEKLQKNGYEAYIVGGCVRDSVLGKEPNDWDITTSAKPNEIKDLFKRTIDTGIMHGTVTVLIDHVGYEVTTYRVDGVYEDHRRPKEVSFTASLTEDLKRRDFTINAMAYNDEEGIVDIFGGREDLDKGIIRCVGEASKRFDEDALRILRAVRFSAQLGFQIEEDTQIAMKNQARFLKDISAERIQVELTKLITSDNPDRLIWAYELGLTSIILPEFDKMMKTTQNNPYHKYDVGMHTIKAMENISATPKLRYTALLHDVAKPETKTTGENGVDHFYGHQELSSKMSKEILRRLKMDNDTIDYVSKLVLYHDYGISEDISLKAFRRFLNKLGIENFDGYISMRKADMLAQSDYKLDERKQSIANAIEMYNEIISNNQCINLSDMAISGKELIELGMKPGRDIGKVLHELFELVLDNPELNDRGVLLDKAKELINQN